MVSTGDPRRTYAYRQMVAKLRAQGLPCWLCGHAIDYTIKGRAALKHPLAFQADHMIPVSVDPSQALNYSLLRPAHRFCNISKSNRAGIKRKGGSRRW